ncbi:MAG TPA: hypothetical protein VM694_01360 [Polyangium sp.]|nr:hypothetical protein [Polyangium sp.]
MVILEDGKRWCVALALTLGAFACSSGGGESTGGEGGAGGVAGPGSGGNAGTTTVASSSSSVGAVASSSASVGSGGAGGAMGFVCDPPAEPGSLYEHSVESYDLNDLEPVPLCKYRGEVVLIVNTAAACGYTPQYAGLQALAESFSGQAFHVLGFLSNDFGNQGGSDEQIGGCIDSYHLSFKQFAIGHVKDPDGAGPEVPQPVWQWILAQQNPGPASTIEPLWNFHKYLISKDGKLVAQWTSSTYPGDDPQNPNDSFDTNPIVQAIQAELAK